MISISELRSVIILDRLTDDMLTKIAPSVTSQTLADKAVIFNEGDDADSFYMLRQGKVLLEKRIAQKAKASLGTIKPGFSFGWSAIAGQDKYTTSAVCAEESDVFVISGSTVIDLLNADYALGYIFMERLTVVLKNRLDRMQEQFLRSIREHPDFKPILEE